MAETKTFEEWLATLDPTDPVAASGQVVPNHDVEMDPAVRRQVYGIDHLLQKPEPPLPDLGVEVRRQIYGLDKPSFPDPVYEPTPPVAPELAGYKEPQAEPALPTQEVPQEQPFTQQFAPQDAPEQLTQAPTAIAEPAPVEQPQPDPVAAYYAGTSRAAELTELDKKVEANLDYGLASIQAKAKALSSRREAEAQASEAEFEANRVALEEVEEIKQQEMDAYRARQRAIAEIDDQIDSGAINPAAVWENQSTASKLFMTLGSGLFRLLQIRTTGTVSGANPLIEAFDKAVAEDIQAQRDNLNTLFRKREAVAGDYDALMLRLEADKALVNTQLGYRIASIQAFLKNKLATSVLPDEDKSTIFQMLEDLQNKRIEANQKKDEALANLANTRARTRLIKAQTAKTYNDINMAKAENARKDTELKMKEAEATATAGSQAIDLTGAFRSPFGTKLADLSKTPDSYRAKFTDAVTGSYEVIRKLSELEALYGSIPKQYSGMGKNFFRTPQGVRAEALWTDLVQNMQKAANGARGSDMDLDFTKTKLKWKSFTNSNAIEAIRQMRENMIADLHQGLSNKIDNYASMQGFMDQELREMGMEILPGSAEEDELTVLQQSFDQDASLPMDIGAARNLLRVVKDPDTADFYNFIGGSEAPKFLKKAKEKLKVHRSRYGDRSGTNTLERLINEIETEMKVNTEGGRDPRNQPASGVTGLQVPQPTWPPE